jgi:hypothetical protein
MKRDANGYNPHARTRKPKQQRLWAERRTAR